MTDIFKIKILTYEVETFRQFQKILNAAWNEWERCHKVWSCYLKYGRTDVFLGYKQWSIWMQNLFAKRSQTIFVTEEKTFIFANSKNVNCRKKLSKNVNSVRLQWIYIVFCSISCQQIREELIQSYYRGFFTWRKKL